MNNSLITRQVYWHIEGHQLMYLFLIISLGAFIYGISKRYRLWKVGKPEKRNDYLKQRLSALIIYGIGQKKVLKDRFSGVSHSFVLWGFILLIVGTVIVMLEADFGIPVMRGNLYLYFQSFVLDVAGLLILIGLLMLTYKRYILKPARLQGKGNHGIVLALLLVIMLTGFFLEGLRILGTADPWGIWSPVGYVLATIINSAGLGNGMLEAFYHFFWWFHMALAFLFIAFIPYSKLLHILSSPANIFMNNLGPKGALNKLDMEEANIFGASRVDDFTIKQLFDLDACTECGRCQDFCPAYDTKKPLSPKNLIIKLRDHLHIEGPKLMEYKAKLTGEENRDDEKSPVVGPVIGEEELWSCTTCGACMEQCPVSIEHVPKIINMRRYLAMDMAEYPDTIQGAIRSLEDRGHPFAGLNTSRTDWYRGLDIKILSEVGQTDLLFWVGCATALNERNHKIAIAFTKILQRAGIDFAILGEEESCTGDPARRLGNEYLFQQIAKENIKMLNDYQVKNIVTVCPHCYNTFRNEYPQFGGNYKVYHHTEIIEQLLNEGKILVGGNLGRRITYHDPCYLGRYNQVYEQPRKILKTIPNLDYVEMKNHHSNSYCCGGGGGRYWADEKGTRISETRAKEALLKCVDIIGTSCPFCMMMLEDGIKGVEGEKDIKVMDLAEIVEICI